MDGCCLFVFYFSLFWYFEFLAVSFSLYRLYVPFHNSGYISIMMLVLSALLRMRISTEIFKVMESFFSSFWMEWRWCRSHKSYQIHYNWKLYIHTHTHAWLPIVLRLFSRVDSRLPEKKVIIILCVCVCIYLSNFFLSFRAIPMNWWLSGYESWSYAWFVYIVCLLL